MDFCRWLAWFGLVYSSVVIVIMAIVRRIIRLWWDLNNIGNGGLRFINYDIRV